MKFEGVFYDSIPSFDENYSHQTELTETTTKELKKLRKPPKYSFKHKFLQILLFIIIGIPRSIFALIFCAIFGFIFIASVTIWRTFGSPEHYRKFLMLLWASGARILLLILGVIKISFHGEYDTDSRFIVSNHISFFDSWLFLPFNPKPLETKEILTLPILRDMSDVFGGIAVDRTKSTGLTKDLLKNAEDTNAPQIFCMPEGATTNGEYMYRFHLGAFLSDLPVQPAAIKYTLWGTNKKISNISYFHEYPKTFIALLGIPAMTVDVTFLEVMNIKADAENDPRKFADIVSLMIGNYLGVKVLNLTTSTLFKGTMH